jgi:hypothetical protein
MRPIANLCTVRLAAACVAATLALTACGGSSGAPARGATTGGSSVRETVVGGVSVHSVERALVAHGGPPRPTSASCRGATAAERAAAPFGHTRRPFFSCLVTVTGERARYDVQVLGNGCYIAERRRPGRAVYGCGADRA